MTDEALDVFGDVASPCRTLARREAPFARALTAIDRPVIRRREGGFPGLFRIIVEQQVSVPSAQAIWARCLAGADPVTTRSVLALGERGLTKLGLSSPKARYVLGLAEEIEEGTFSFADLAALGDDEALSQLQKVKGVGPWSAAIYLLFCEGRPDIWPPKDVALKAAYSAAAGVDEPVAQAALDEKSEDWAPYRGLAAHILWTYYAHLRGRTPI